MNESIIRELSHELIRHFMRNFKVEDEVSDEAKAKYVQGVIDMEYSLTDYIQKHKCKSESLSDN